MVAWQQQLEAEENGKRSIPLFCAHRTTVMRGKQRKIERERKRTKEFDLGVYIYS